MEGANFAQRYDAQAQSWFARKAARTKRVVAVKALACKLAKAAFYVLRDEVDFDAARMFGGGHVGAAAAIPGSGMVSSPMV